MSLATPELEPATGMLPPDIFETLDAPGPEVASGALHSYCASDGQRYPLGAPHSAFAHGETAGVPEQQAAVDGYVGRYGALIQERDGALASLELARGHSVAFFDAQLQGVRSQYLNELHDARPVFRATACDRYERRVQDIEAARGLAIERADIERDRLAEEWSDDAVYRRAMAPAAERRSRMQSLLQRAQPLVRRVFSLA